MNVGATGTVVQGNTIGVNATGTALGNNGSGIFIGAARVHDRRTDGGPERHFRQRGRTA